MPIFEIFRPILPEIVPLDIFCDGTGSTDTVSSISRCHFMLS